MTEDLQGLLEKINRDGLEKAEAESAKIIAAAKAKSETIIADARAQAEVLRKDAELAAADYAKRGAETVAQAARDTVLTVKDAITKLLEKLLKNDVDSALADEGKVAALVLDAIKNLTGPGEITGNSKLAAALKAQVANLKNFTVITDETFGAGFTVKTEGGRVEHTFTAEAIAEDLARRLRPDLAQLLK